MAFFQSRKIQLLAVFIIIAAAVIWTYQDTELTVDAVLEPISETDIIEEKIKAVPYLEKIENFALEEYTEDHLLAYFIEAEYYYNFENSPITLLNIKVTTYDEHGNKGFVLSSNRANYLRSGEIYFNGEVSIQSNGVDHKLDTEQIIVRPEMNLITSDRDVTYLGENAKIHAEGMEIKTDNDTMKLTGDIRIEQNSGTEIETKNLFVDQSDGQKHYHTEEHTTYLSEMSIINADKGMDLDMNRHIIQLLGKVEILQSSGSKIQSTNLIVDQSNGGEVYKTNNTIRYQSQGVDILAQSMHFDVKRQRIELSGGVTARYE